MGERESEFLGGLERRTSKEEGYCKVSGLTFDVQLIRALARWDRRGKTSSGAGFKRLYGNN